MVRGAVVRDGVEIWGVESKWTEECCVFFVVVVIVVVVYSFVLILLVME